MSDERRVACVLVAAGRGERLGEARPKSLVEIGGQPLVAHAVRSIAAADLVRDIVVVVPPESTAEFADIFHNSSQPHAGANVETIPGGLTRQDSVACGLSALGEDADMVLVHDAARCLAPPKLYDAVAREVMSGHDAVIPGIGVVDTLKEVDDSGNVVATPDRSRLRAVQTPQGFARSVLERAHDRADARGDVDAPDDAALVERIGLPVRIIAGHPDAFKITRPHDLVLAETVLTRPRLGVA